MRRLIATALFIIVFLFLCGLALAQDSNQFIGEAALRAPQEIPAELVEIIRSCSKAYIAPVGANTPAGMDAKTGLPVDRFLADGTVGNNVAQPVLGGYYLNYLSSLMALGPEELVAVGIFENEAVAREALLSASERALNSLLQAQGSPVAWNGLLRWHDFDFKSTTNVVAFVDNAILSASIACFIGNCERARGNFPDHAEKLQALIDNAYTFLNAQLPGYKAFYDPVARQFHQVRIPEGFPEHAYIDRAFAEHRAATAFVVVYFGAMQTFGTDPRPAFTELPMVFTDNGLAKPWDGGGFQMFWPLLVWDETAMPGMNKALRGFYNAAAAESDRLGVVGLLSSCAIPEVPYYDGKIGYPALKETIDPVRSDVGSLYSLAAALRVNPADVIERITGALKTHPELNGAYGPYDSMTKSGEVVDEYVGVDQLSLVLGLLDQGPEGMRSFLESQGLTGAMNSLYLDLASSNGFPTQ